MLVPSPARLHPTSRHTESLTPEGLLGDNSEGQEREKAPHQLLPASPLHCPLQPNQVFRWQTQADMNPHSSISTVLGAEPFLLARGTKTTRQEMLDLPATNWVDRVKGGDSSRDRSRGPGRAPCPKSASAGNAQPSSVTLPAPALGLWLLRFHSGEAFPRRCSSVEQQMRGS